jgi:transposase
VSPYCLLILQVGFDKSYSGVIKQAEQNPTYEELWETNRSLVEANKVLSDCLERFQKQANERILDLEAQLAALQAKPGELGKIVEHSSILNQAPLVQIQASNPQAEQNIELNSSNSGRPPSSDTPWSPKSQRTKSGKKSGGQPKHPGSTLKMVENPDHIITHTVDGFCSCGLSINQNVVSAHESRQVFDLPPIRLEVTEHRAQIVTCSCGCRHKASFPSGVSSQVQYGPQIVACAVYLNNQHAIPYERTTEILSDMFGADISEGSLYNFNHRAYECLEQTEQDIVNELLKSPTLHADETGVNINGENHWLHVASNQYLTHYHVHKRRGKSGTIAGNILNRYTNTVVHDCYGSYFGFNVRHVLCVAHLLRELKRVEEQTGQTWATELADLLRQANREVAKSDTKMMDIDSRLIVSQRYQELVEVGVGENPACTTRSAKSGKIRQTHAHNLLKRLVKYKDEILRFTSDPDVPFDNNQAERDVRMVKLRDKVSGCARGKGMILFARIRGYLSTAKKQGHNAYKALTQVFMGTPLSFKSG